MNIIGEVKDRHCILVDDLLDGGGTLCNAADALMAAGAVSVGAYVTHAIFSGRAIERLMNSPIATMVATDSIKAGQEVQNCTKFRALSVAPLLAETILRISEERSVSSLFH
jgi:ribose-phosphate pyrophosphokinase